MKSLDIPKNSGSSRAIERRGEGVMASMLFHSRFVGLECSLPSSSSCSSAGPSVPSPPLLRISPCTSITGHGSSFIISSNTSSRGKRLPRHAKFQRFEQGEEEAQALAAASRAESNGTVFTVEDATPYYGSTEASEEDKSDDNVLPDDLQGAVLHSSESTVYYISAGGTRAIVELLLPELENLNDDGAQQRLWDLAKFYLECLQKDLGDQRLKAIFPDAGSAALLKHTWPEATFGFGSLNDRKPVKSDDDVVVLVVPDYQMLGEVQKIASFLNDDGENLDRPLIMWNPRLFSGDVGVGLNVRRFRDRFVSTFTVVYSMRPLPEGAIFRRYPGLWQVFLDDKKRPGRYKLAKEQPRRPNPDDLDLLLLGGAAEEDSEEPSPFVKAMAVFASFNRFMRSLSK